MLCTVTVQSLHTTLHEDLFHGFCVCLFAFITIQLFLVSIQSPPAHSIHRFNMSSQPVADGSLASVVMKELQQVAEKFKSEDDEGRTQYSPYAHLEKAAVLQEARIFHDSTAVRENPRQCCTIIAQLLHLQNTGQFLSSTEATDVFFGVTKLFMSDDASLRRMVYLFIKVVAETCSPDDVIIVTSSLTKDMTCDVDLYRANALRVLARIIDSAMLGAIERYVKQAIVDSSGQVSSAALVSAVHLFSKSPENASVIKRWISEVQEATSSPNLMVQFHAMQLIYLIKANDRLGVSKLVQQFSTKNSLKSPLALVCLIRYTTKLLMDEVMEGRSAGGYQSEASSLINKGGYQFLESCLRNKVEMVSYEAARSICSLPQAEPEDISPAISVLQLQLSSSKTAVRFASIKTLSVVANNFPRLVSKCNEELETLLADANRTIATLAITTLLKTGSENSIDRLLKQISTFFSDIADEYKITVVQSLEKLCFTYPSKHRVLVGFMSNFLREEGGFEFKRTIVTSITSLMRAVPETAESSLLHLCEFIEDCEFTLLSTQILHLLGELGPSTSSPARFIRFIHNRVILENPAVRAAAITALGKFAAQCPSLRSSITTLLNRSLGDEDDETRDRTVVVLTIIERAMEEHPYVPPPEDAQADEIPPDQPVAGDIAAYLLLDSLPMSFDKLQRSLMRYMAAPGAMESQTPLTFASLPVVEDYPEEAKVSDPLSSYDIPSVSSNMGQTNPVSKDRVDPASAVYAIPEFASLGQAFRSSMPVALTESETEYVVTCIKHMFLNHVVLQFNVQNTVEDQRLENVSMLLESDSECFEVSGEMEAKAIKYGETKSCFTLLTRDHSKDWQSTPFTCTLRFNVVQVDPASGEDESEPFDEEYALESLSITTGDYMAKTTVSDFRRSWETLGSTHEVTEKFALQQRSLEDALASVISSLGMQPCDGTGTVKAGGKPHMLHASGVFIGGKNVLVRAQIASNQDSVGTVLKIAVRSDDPIVSKLVAECVL